MNRATAWDRVLAAQQDDGSFASDVRLRDGPVLDRNAFATVLVLDSLRLAPPTHEVDRARSRAVEFLLRCADPQRPGRFGFYPNGDHPAWLVSPLPFDADDTALINTALFNDGRVTSADLAAVVDCHLLPFRVEYLSERSEPWRRIGAFETWLDPQALRNPVDCTVNCNVLTMLHLERRGRPEVEAITSMLIDGVAWAGSLKARAKQLSPWYPEPIELVHAVVRAARAGVPGLADLSVRLHRLDWVRADLGRDLAICGSSDGRITWTCRPLALARRLLETDNRPAALS